MTEQSAHRWLGYENPTPGRFVAVCSCGWRSTSYTSAGLAGSAADQHRRELGAVDGDGQSAEAESAEKPEGQEPDPGR